MRRTLTLSSLITIVLTLVVSVHVYLARRLVLDPDVLPPVRGLLLAFVALLALTIVLRRPLCRILPPKVAQVLTWISYLWMGFSWLLFLSLAASDLVFWLLGLTPALDRWDPVSLARVQAVASLCLGTAVGLFSIRAALRPPALRRTEIVLSRWPQALDGFRILQLSDVHIGQVLGRRFAAGVVERCNRSKPDLIALTGDLVDGGVDRLREEVLPFARLRARHGVFFVTGNHDYYSGADPWVECLQGLGLRALRNERVAIGEGDTVFELAGVDDRHGKLFGEGQGEDLEQALLGRDPDRAVVLLAHQPLGFREAAGMGVDLQISGHTHGGQIWPFGYIVRLFTPYVAGHYRVNGSQLYVSRGTGFWGPPMRFLAPAEITEIVLRSSKP